MTYHDRTSPVVVGVDGSTSAVHAVRWGATQAERTAVPLRLVQACQVPVGNLPEIVDPRTAPLDVQRQGRRWLDEAQDAVATVAPGLRPQLSLQRAPVVPALVAESRHASMVLLGTRGLGGFTGLLVGSTTVRLAGHAHSPVVVVRGRLADDAPPTDGPVVVGVDGTPASEAAIAFAFDEASARGCDLVAAHAWTDSPIDIVRAQGATIWDFAPAQQHASEILAERLAGWQEKYPEVHVIHGVVHHRAIRALLHCAQTAQLVVVGSRGRGGFRSLAIGSTNQHLLQYAPCPVAVVRSDTDR